MYSGKRVSFQVGQNTAAKVVMTLVLDVEWSKTKKTLYVVGYKEQSPQVWYDLSVV
jgi:hypothetical protein